MLLSTLYAFFHDHRRGELDGSVESERVWMTCAYGAIVRELEPVFIEGVCEFFNDPVSRLAMHSHISLDVLEISSRRLLTAVPVPERPDLLDHGEQERRSQPE